MGPDAMISGFWMLSVKPPFSLSSFTFNISPSNEHPGLISFRMDWLDFLAVQGTLKSILLCHSLKASVLWHSAWVSKNWCFSTVVLEKTLESPLDCKEIQPVHPKGNQSWIFIGRTDAEAETPILWPPDAKSRLIRKDPDGRKDRRQEEKWMTEDEMVG